MMDAMELPPRPAFGSDDEYEASLLDAVFWAPYMRATLGRAGLPDKGEVVTHFPTTHVSALVGARFFVKLHYEDWFGEECFQTERTFYETTRGCELPVPDLLAEGALYEDEGWRWPFLVLTMMPGKDVRSIGDATDGRSMERVASFVGSTMRRLHDLPVVEREPLVHSTYADLINDRMAKSERDHVSWRSLPERLATSVRDYVWARRDLVDPDRSSRRLIHGDLHGGNIFVAETGDGWDPTGIVDFNDAMIGDPHYDLVSLHLKAFRADKSLLRIAMDAYGWEEVGSDWPERMMAFTLVHDYDMIEPVVSAFPGALEGAGSLEDVADLLWSLDSPGPGEIR
jgi:hygromycin-B 7''-O-kinase